jgi:DNA helicase II / ATP-dependent DNA helicase PcrA
MTVSEAHRRKMNSAEREEHARLKECLERIDAASQAIRTRLKTYAKEVQASKSHMWEARRDMDHIEKIAIHQTIEQKMRSGGVLQEQLQKLQKLKNSPWFGRFDFVRDRDRDDGAQPIYIGVHDFRDVEAGETLV